jgi:hypothetical protein
MRKIREGWEKSEKQKTRSARSGFIKNGVFQSPLKAAGIGSTQRVKQPATATKDGRMVWVRLIMKNGGGDGGDEKAADRPEASREFAFFAPGRPRRTLRRADG